jgi:hypothetical protein
MGQLMNMIVKTSNYSMAAFEYAGLVSFSYVKRSGQALKCGISKMGPPIKRVTVTPVMYCGQKICGIGNVFKRKNVIEERLLSIVEKLDSIDSRLATIENMGISVAERPKQVKEKKPLNDGKKMLLKAIVSENILLRQPQEGMQ